MASAARKALSSPATGSLFAQTTGILRASAFHSSAATQTWWGHVKPAPKDPILGVTEAFLADQSPDKVNVGVVS